MEIIINDRRFEFSADLLSKFQEYLILDDIFSQYEILEDKEEEQDLDLDIVEDNYISFPPTPPPSPITPTSQSYTFEEINNIFRVRFSSESDYTLRNNASTLRSLAKIFKNYVTVNIDMFHDSALVISKLNETKLKPSSKKSYYHTIVKFYKCLNIIPPKGYYNEIGILKTRAQEDKVFTANVKEKPLLQFLRDNEDMLRERLLNNIVNKNVSWMHFQKRVLFSLYVDFPPFRKEWKDVICVPEDMNGSEHNYYNRNTGKICLNNFKNKSENNPQMSCNINSYPKVKNVLDEWLEHHPMSEEIEYPMFLNKSGNKLKDGTFNTMMHVIFDGKKISVNILRKYYVSKHIFTGIHSPKEIKEIHRIMNHSADTCITEYAKSF